jgi:hypothetical protein
MNRAGEGGIAFPLLFYKKKGRDFRIPSLFYRVKYELVLELALTDAEHLGPAGGADTLGGRSAVLHGNDAGVLHFLLGAALDTVCLHLIPPMAMMINHAQRACQYD